MQNITKKNSFIHFEKSDQQILLELFTELEILDKKGIFQEGSIEILESMISKPNTLLTDFLSKPQELLYFKSDIEKKEALSLWDLYKETNDTHYSSFQIVGSSALYFLGYANLVEQLKKIRVKKNQKLLWELLPLGIQHSLEELCKKRGNDLDVRIQKNNKEPLHDLLTKVDQCLIKKLNCFDQNFFMQNFYVQRCPIEKEKTLWTIQSFYYGNSIVDYCQFIEAPRTYRFIKEALLLEMDLDKGEIEFKTQNPLIFIQSLLDVILKVSHSDLNNLLEDNDLGMLAYNQSRFHTCSREEEEENLINHIFTKNKENNTAKLEKILKTTHKKHSQKSLCALVCLLLNSLRICAPHINEEELVNAMKQELSFSEKKSYIHTLCEMLLKKISFEKISSLVQVVAFAALHHYKGSIDKKKICLVKHRDVEHLQIGSENSILLKWDIQKALKVVQEHFNFLSPFFSSCLLGLNEPLNLSEHEIFFISAHEAGEFELAFKEFSLLDKKSNVLKGRVFSNPHIPQEQKSIYLSRFFSKKKKNEETNLLLLSELNAAAKDKLNLPPLPNFIIHFLLNHKNKEHYSDLIRLMPLEKIHFVWEKEFQNLQNNQTKLLFFTNAIQFYHQFNIKNQLEAISLSSTHPSFKIDSSSSYIHTLCEMLLKSIDLEKISSALQVVFFASIYQTPSLSSNEHKFNVIQIGEENIFIKCDIKKAVQIVEEHFNSLSCFLPLFQEKRGSLSADEILFIAAQKAGEFKCALKIFRRCKESRNIAKHFTSNPNIPIQEKIVYLLEILNLKNSSEEVFYVLSGLNECLIHIKNPPPLNLQKEYVDIIWKKKNEYPHIFSCFSAETVQKLCFQEFNLINDIEKKFVFVCEEIEFYKKQHLTIDWSAMVVPLYQDLIHHSLSQKAIQLRSLFKKKKDIQNKMTLLLEIKPKDNSTALIKNKNFNVESLNLLLQSKKEDFFKQHDETLAQFFSYITEKSLQEINWKKLKPHLKNLPKTKLSLNKRLYDLSIAATNSWQIELLQHHSHFKKILLHTAQRLKDNMILSRKCFQLILQSNTDKILKENINLNVLFSAYIDEDSLLWLLQYSPCLPSHFSIKQENFLIFFNQLGCKLALILNHPKRIQTCFHWLFSHNIWTPALAESFILLYKKLNNQKQTFKDPQDSSYEKLFQNICSVELLDCLIPLCFSNDESFNPKAFYFIEQLIALLKRSPKLKENQCFILMQDTLINYFEETFGYFLEKGTSRENWSSFIHQCAFLSPYLQENSKERASSIVSESILIIALFEKNLNFFNKLCEIHLKGKNNEEKGYFFYQLFCSVFYYINNSKETNSHLIAYQAINRTPFNHLPCVKIKKFPSCEFKHFNQIGSEISNWLYGSATTSSLSQFDKILYSRLKDLYSRLKDILIHLIDEKTDLSTCLDLALNWTLTQFKFEDRSLLTQLRPIAQALVKEIDPLKINPTNTRTLIQLISISNIFFQQQIKEEIKQLPNFEDKFLSLFDPKQVALYKFQLINEITVIHNNFSLAFFHEYLQEDIVSIVKLTNEWKTHLEPNWKTYCNNNAFKAMYAIYNYAIQSYLLSQHNQLSCALSFAITSFEMMSDFLKIYSEKEMYHEHENILLFQLQPLINSLYFSLHASYKQHSKKDEYRTFQTLLSIAYYKWLKFFFTAFESEQRFDLLGYSFDSYMQDLSLKFRILIYSRANDLDKRIWKQLVSDWYHLPKSLFIKDQKEHYEKIYESFDDILKNNNIDKKELEKK